MVNKACDFDTGDNRLHPVPYQHLTMTVIPT